MAHSALGLDAAESGPASSRLVGYPNAFFPSFAGESVRFGASGLDVDARNWIDVQFVDADGTDKFRAGSE